MRPPQYKFGAMYAQGKRMSLQSVAQAPQMVSQVRQNRGYARAQHDVAMMYGRADKAVPQDFCREAAKLVYRKGCPAGPISRRNTIWALMYYNGQGFCDLRLFIVPQDNVRAQLWVQPLAADGVRCRSHQVPLISRQSLMDA
jgi:TPR repeat protein